jgi:hypothetical protein
LGRYLIIKHLFARAWEKIRGNLTASLEGEKLETECFQPLGMKQELEKINQNFKSLN